MGTRNRFLILAVAAFGFYLVLHLILDDLILYVIGGALGTIIKLFNMQVNIPLLVFGWIALLLTCVFFYYRIKNSPTKYLFLLSVIMLLYVVDFILFEMLSFDNQGASFRLFNISVKILIKGLILSSIIYSERNLNSFNR